MRIKILAFSLAFSAIFFQSPAQETNDSTDLIDTGVMYVEPLFEYPVAPEEISGFTEKCDWLVDNFWTNLDLKKKEAVDQNKLNHAFKIYVTTCQYAAKEKATASVDKLIKNLQKNPMLLYQMTKAAEENIYGPRAEFWIDELYLRFLNGALANKKFPKQRRERYELQRKQLENSQIGSQPGKFDFTRPNGDAAQYFPMSTPTILVFGDPECDDCRIGKLRMQSNVNFNKAVNDGKINILFIIPDPDDDWQKKVADFPKSWTVGASDSVSEILDIREIPEIYVVDGDRKIVKKHIGFLQAMDAALSLINNN